MRDAFNGLERRAFGRRRSCIHATLYVPGRPPSPCVLRNFSPKGALIEASELLDPPFQVKLRLNSNGRDVECEVRQVRGRHIGVSFIGEGAADELTRALGGIVRSRNNRVLPAPGSMPRLNLAELRRTIFRPKKAG